MIKLKYCWIAWGTHDISREGLLEDVGLRRSGVEMHGLHVPACWASGQGIQGLVYKGQVPDPHPNRPANIMEISRSAQHSPAGMMFAHQALPKTQTHFALQCLQGPPRVDQSNCARLLMMALAQCYQRAPPPQVVTPAC